MVKSVTNEIGFSMYVLSKPQVSHAANRAHWQAGLLMSFEDFQSLKNTNTPPFIQALLAMKTGVLVY